MIHDVREYIDRLQIAGHTIGEDHDDDPVLIDAEGRAVDTWRENYPYDERMDRTEYDEQKYLLQVELLKFQNCGRHRRQARAASSRAATRPARAARSSGSWSTSTRATAGSSRWPSPPTASSTSGTSSATCSHLPTAGEMVLFDRTWYNRAGVERVMGFATDEEYEQFMHQAPLFEQMLSRAAGSR